MNWWEWYVLGNVTALVVVFSISLSIGLAIKRNPAMAMRYMMRRMTKVPSHGTPDTEHATRRS